MTSKRDISNYPEHLNPFHEDTLAEKIKFWTLGRKKRGSFGGSLNELKQSIRQSFRGKKGAHANDTNGVELRNRSGSSVNCRQAYTIAVAQRNESPSPALPRSRITERINMGKEKDKTDVSETRKNPFEIEKERRRRKKKAPLPPSLSSTTINEELGQDYLKKPHSDSKWSITSADTDISSNYTASEIGDVEITNDNIDRAFKNFTNDLEKLADDTNNNLITNGKKEIPDIVVSCENKDNTNNDDVVNEENDDTDGGQLEDDNNNAGGVSKDTHMQDDDGTHNTSKAPTPKIRKTKLNKSVLLGNDFPYADT